MSESENIAALEARVAALEEELRIARERSAVLDGVLVAVPAIIVHLDADFRIREASRIQAGYRREDVIGESVFNLSPEHEVPMLREKFDRVLETGNPEQHHTRATGPNGRTSEYDFYVARTTNRGGDEGLILVVIDVTERTEREREYAASEAARVLAVEATGLGLWSFDARSGVMTWNEAMHRICGVEEPLAFDEFVDVLVHPDDRDDLRAASHGYVRADRFQTRAFRLLRPDGSTRWVVTSARVLKDENGELLRMIGTTLDVTSERRTEEHLRQTQRLEAVGQLAAGVAHNFNNILASIIPVLEIVQTHVPLRYRAIVEGAGQSARRAAELVRQLMTFAGQRTGPARRLEKVGRIAESACSLCRRVLDARIALTFDDRSNQACVRCDPGAVEHAIVNLVLNARDAIDETGRGSGHIHVEVFRDEAGRDACVRVADDGIGMSDDVAQRVFEPFFTTKDVGHGTGLGLAITYATVRDHGGSTTCVSEPGEGTTFEIKLPIEARDSIRPRESGTPIEDLGASRRILLVEDDDQVATAVAFLLSELGHEVCIATNAESAVELARAESGLSLVLLDRAMPGEYGDAALPALRALLPGVPIAYFTGEDVDEVARKRVDGVLPKPATGADIEALLDALAPAPRA